MQWGVGNVYLFLLSTLKSRHCQKTHCCNGLVDNLGSSHLICQPPNKTFFKNVCNLTLFFRAYLVRPQAKLQHVLQTALNCILFGIGKFSSYIRFPNIEMLKFTSSFNQLFQILEAISYLLDSLKFFRSIQYKIRSDTLHATEKESFEQVVSILRNH